MLTRTAFSILTAAVMSVVVAGCGDSDNPASPQSAAWREPAVASYYTFLVYESSDSLGLPLPESGATGVRTITNNVLETGKSYRGVDNLVALTDAGTVLLLDHRSNGDLAFATERKDTTGNEWFVLPVGSRGTITQAQNRQTFPGVFGDTSVTIMNGTATYAGSETMTVGGESILVHRIDHIVVARASDRIDTRTTTTRIIYWIAPSTGFFVKRVVVPNENSPSGKYEVMMLKDYTIR